MRSLLVPRGPAISFVTNGKRGHAKVQGHARARKGPRARTLQAAELLLHAVAEGRVAEALEADVVAGVARARARAADAQRRHQRTRVAFVDILGAVAWARSHKRAQLLRADDVQRRQPRQQLATEQCIADIALTVSEQELLERQDSNGKRGKESRMVKDADRCGAPWPSAAMVRLPAPPPA